MIVFILYIIKLPQFLYWIIKDIYIYYREKLYLEFFGWGLHLYVGTFGSGKTLSMVTDCYKKCVRYPQITVVTNLKLMNFPEHTQILPLNKPDDILNAPKNTIVLIDEIGTIFNSRDFASKSSLPKILFQHICQCRKRKLQILATTQVWNFLDKQLRDITATVTTCHSHFKHPFTRITTNRTYDKFEYDRAFENYLYPISPLSVNVFVQTDFIRTLYDTEELIQGLLNKEYLTDEEILMNQQGISNNVVEIEKKSKIKRRI